MSHAVIPPLYRGLVVPVKPQSPKYYHGTYPGAATSILRNGFKGSRMETLHEFHDGGGPGVYTYMENNLSTPQNGLA